MGNCLSDNTNLSRDSDQQYETDNDNDHITTLPEKARSQRKAKVRSTNLESSLWDNDTKIMFDNQQIIEIDQDNIEFQEELIDHIWFAAGEMIDEFRTMKYRLGTQMKIGDASKQYKDVAFTEEFDEMMPIVYRMHGYDKEPANSYEFKGGFKCLEYDDESQQLLVHGYCKSVERSLNIFIPMAVADMIYFYHSQMDGINIDMFYKQEKIEYSMFSAYSR